MQIHPYIHTQSRIIHTHLCVCVYIIYLKKQDNKIANTLLEAGTSVQNLSAPSNCCMTSK